MDEQNIQARKVRAICGDVSDMWLWRKLNDPNSGFPKPAYVGRRRFWREADVREWWARQHGEANAARAEVGAA